MREVKRLRFLETHEWIDVEGNRGTVGISAYAQSEISDVVFVELPEIGRVVKAKEACSVVESVKAAFDIYAPVSGKIIEVNAALSERPEIVNKSPYDEGWFFKLELSDPEELDRLMDFETYEKHKAPH